MDKELLDLIHELLRLGHEAVSLSDGHKMNEPSFSMTWQRDGSIDGEFYSYCLDLRDGGRHHTFCATSEKDLLAVLKGFIEDAKKEIQETKNRDNPDSEDQERMANEGG
ncbi:MAG TPA: hypothetical protein ENH82_09885 [bacterium]|nr:hypothetical protein [bacterium]